MQTAFRASKCEASIAGQPLDEATLASALTALDEDLAKVGLTEAYGDAEYRQKLMR